ncbi:DUF488 domain-containing protein [Myroides indicus]|uniref:Uncharacterized protein DUF488 n=1 Tax=Myroides indicus TaxID=1323422 RepID=A0A4R7EVP9_9FLAO|nr:DUF488 domain-containing protein [Myroides indicus]TDS54576.1 uncharacterized protein DUF488 [Myroides indicus]
MNTTDKHIIYTIGHSTCSLNDFLILLKSFKIQTLVDIRSFPGSRKFPQFDKENLKVFLEKHGIHYIYLKELGGRRKPDKKSKNTRWKNTSFRGYADYMETEEFSKGIDTLEKAALQSTTAYMCAEAVWWRCHRSMVSDYLKAKGWMVFHIMGINKQKEHPFTSPAIVIDKRVFYSDENFLDQ